MVDIYKNGILFLKYTETLNLVGEFRDLFMQIFQVHPLPEKPTARTVHHGVSGLCPVLQPPLMPETAAGGFICWGMNVPRLLL